MSETEGASATEQILHCARFNNTELLSELLASLSPGEEGSSSARTAELINTARDALGNTPLHLAASRGNYEVLDILLDQEGVELDPHNTLDGDTPLHLAVKYSESEPEHGKFVVEELVEAGADVLAKNKGGLKPSDIADGEVRDVLVAAEYALEVEEAGTGVQDNAIVAGEEDPEGEASASDSD